MAYFDDKLAHMREMSVTEQRYQVVLAVIAEGGRSWRWQASGAAPRTEVAAIPGVGKIMNSCGYTVI
jgi:hypothetical protein